MAKLDDVVVETTKEDLKEVLIAFWLETMQDKINAEYPERMKASENLAKYILGSGKTSVTRRPVGRPSTLDVLKLAQMFENEAEGTNGTSGESPRD